MRRRHSYPSPNHTLTHIDHCTAYGWLCTSHVLSLMEILSTWPSNGRFNETFQIRSFKQPKCSPRVLWGCGSLTRQHRCFQKPDCTLIWAGSHLFIGACVEILARSFARDNETLGLTSFTDQQTWRTYNSRQRGETLQWSKSCSQIKEKTWLFTDSSF